MRSQSNTDAARERMQRDGDERKVDMRRTQSAHKDCKRQVECIWPVARTVPVGAPVGDPPGGSSDTASTACAFICATISGGSVIVAG
jgi:hypothetical protein